MHLLVFTTFHTPQFGLTLNIFDKSTPVLDLSIAIDQQSSLESGMKQAGYCRTNGAEIEILGLGSPLSGVATPSFALIYSSRTA